MWAPGEAVNTPHARVARCSLVLLCPLHCDAYLCWLSENSLFVFLLLCVTYVLSWKMFRASQFPSMCVCEWSKDIRMWAAVDDENWVQFAQNLGDSALAMTYSGQSYLGPGLLGVCYFGQMSLRQEKSAKTLMSLFEG